MEADNFNFLSHTQTNLQNPTMITISCDRIIDCVKGSGIQQWVVAILEVPRDLGADLLSAEY